MRQLRRDLGQTKYQRLWRKEKIEELAADGLSNREISSRLKIPHASVDRIVNELMAEVRIEDKKFNDEYLPYEYKKTLAGVQGLIRYMSDIITAKDEATGEYKYEVRDRLQAGALKLQAYNAMLEMAAGRVLSYEGRVLAEKYRGLTGQNSEVVRDAIKQPA